MRTHDVAPRDLRVGRRDAVVQALEGRSRSRRLQFRAFPGGHGGSAREGCRDVAGVDVARSQRLLLTLRGSADGAEGACARTAF